MTLRKTKEKKRLSNLKREADEHPSVNTAKRYKLPEAAVDIISKAGVIHGQQSRAIQIGAELLLRMKEGVSDDDMRTILDSPLIAQLLPTQIPEAIDELDAASPLGDIQFEEKDRCVQRAWQSPRRTQLVVSSI